MVRTVESFLSNETVSGKEVAEIFIQVSMQEASSTVSCAAGRVGCVGCSLQLVKHRDDSINTKKSFMVLNLLKEPVLMRGPGLLAQE